MEGGRGSGSWHEGGEGGEQENERDDDEECGRASEDTDDWLQRSPLKPRGKKVTNGREARRACWCGEREGSKTKEGTWKRE